MKIIGLALTAIILTTLALQAQPTGTSVNLRATLILASNEGSGMDRPLRDYERQLQRLGFSSYRIMGSGSGRFGPGQTGEIRLGGNFRIQLAVKPGPGNRIPVDVRWSEGTKTLISTSGTLPLVLGGPRHGNGVLILIIDGQ